MNLGRTQFLFITTFKKCSLVYGLYTKVQKKAHYICVSGIYLIFACQLYAKKKKKLNKSLTLLPHTPTHNTHSICLRIRAYSSTGMLKHTEFPSRYTPSLLGNFPSYGETWDCCFSVTDTNPSDREIWMYEDKYFAWVQDLDLSHMIHLHDAILS